MEIIHTLSIPFYKFKADPAVTAEILTICESLEYIKEPPDNFGFVHANFYHRSLFDFFDESIRQVKQIYYKDELDFPIVDCWVNKYLPLHKLHPHSHSNAVICGVFYVTSNDNTCATKFEIKDPWVVDNDLGLSLSINKNYNKITTEIMPEAGTLIVFPSSIVHSMKTITNTKAIKYTVAFNTFPSGTVSNFKSQMLSLQSLSLREKLGK